MLNDKIIKQSVLDLIREIKIFVKHIFASLYLRYLLGTRQSIWLELGGGINKKKGWINIDLYGKGNLHLDLRRPMPFPDNSVDRIYTEHFLEHFSYTDLIELLKECFRILKVGGTFSSAVPDAGRVFRAYVKGKENFYDKKYWSSPDWCKCPMDELNWLIYMDGEHNFMFDEENLILRLKEVGFSDVNIRNYDSSIDNYERKNQSIYIVAIKNQSKWKQ